MGARRRRRVGAFIQRTLEGLAAADGTLIRLVRRGDAPHLDAAVRVPERLPGDQDRPSAHPVGLLPNPVLAEWATDGTKALVPGTSLEQLALRPHHRRPCRPGTRPQHRAEVCDWLRDAADFGIVFRLTLHQLANDPVVSAARTIFVCENPAVLCAAAGELQEAGAALVCTEGVPSAPCHRLLGDAVRARARLHWRTDFGWGRPACVSPRTPWPAQMPVPGG